MVAFVWQDMTSLLVFYSGLSSGCTTIWDVFNFGLRRFGLSASTGMIQTSDSRRCVCWQHLATTVDVPSATNSLTTIVACWSHSASSSVYSTMVDLPWGSFAQVRQRQLILVSLDSVLSVSVQLYEARTERYVLMYWLECVGTLMGITNTIATLPGFLGPAAVGAITYRNVSVILHSLSWTARQTLYLFML